MENLKKGILYISLHNLLVRKEGNNKVISRKDLFIHIARHFLVPKKLRPILLKEMCDKKLLEQVNRDFYKILECDIDLNNDANKLYQLCGLF